MLQFTTATFFYLLGCLALGVSYAYLLYSPKSELSKTQKYIFFALRTMAVALIVFLLFAPLIKTISNTLAKPIIIIAQDNSASLKLSSSKSFDPKTYSSAIRQLEKALSDDYEVRSFSFSGAVKDKLDFKYDGKLTDISSVFKTIEDKFSNRNIGAVIMATDGIYNRGGNPQYEGTGLEAPVYTIALGDTTPKRDLLIQNINYNNIVYLDNQFQLEVSLEGYESQGARSRLTVSDNSGILFSKPVSIKSNEYRENIPVTLLAKKKGIQRLTVNISPISNELSVQNNRQIIFVEVVDGRRNVLIIANSPHPDLAAIKQSVEINKNYEVKTVLAESLINRDAEKADVIILHQLPSVTNPAKVILQRTAGKPVLFILGAQSNTSAFTASQPFLTISSTGATHEALAQMQTDFYLFTLSDTTKSKLQTFAPLLTPFGNYALKSPGSVLLSQKIGNVATAMPLLAFSDQGQRKIGVLAGEGIWRWRLEEFRESAAHIAVNELTSKMIQYLASGNDKRKFRVYSAKNTFDENEPVLLNAELYNDAYELVNTPDVSIAIKNKSGKNYNYLFSRNSNSYVLDGGILPSGEYSYDAKTKLGNNNYTAKGQFVVVQQQAELQQTTANHQLLYAMAQQSGGKMLYPDQLASLPKLIRDNETVKTISYEDRKYEELINLKLIFFLILALISVEWFSRKRNGEI